ncbi:hypothetical protein [Zoogloea sp.]|uniref:hypothetical protein n=1 Tax=Zoogloea sp. TaxID=49181 RepID=UPI0026110A2B|nr:hypothetical protein [Zoogloea sp.]MDD3354155.1 hypothetical protein [Zoogloea sp.]
MPKKKQANKQSNPSRFFDPRPHSPIKQFSPPTALMMKAGRLAGFEGRDGWPDELSVREFSGLQFPDSGLAQADFLRALWGYEWSEWLGEHGATVIRDNAPGPGLCRVSGADVLHLYGVEPSELLREWFASSDSPAYQLIRGRHAGACPVSTEPAISQKVGSAVAPTTQRGRVKFVLEECERRAKENEIPFDRSKMPGNKQDFLDLMKRMEPSFKNMALASLGRYLKRQCTWGLSAASNASATPLYEKLFPEAFAKPRAVLKKA